jgi:hypothetical protein
MNRIVCQRTNAAKDCAGTNRKNSFLLSLSCHARCAFWYQAAVCLFSTYLAVVDRRGNDQVFG